MGPLQATNQIDLGSCRLHLIDGDLRLETMIFLSTISAIYLFSEDSCEVNVYWFLLAELKGKQFVIHDQRNGQ